MSAAEKETFVSLADLLRERRITALGNQVKAAVASGDPEEAQRLMQELQAACLARSPEQVERMERQRGLRR